MLNLSQVQRDVAFFSSKTRMYTEKHRKINYVNGYNIADPDTRYGSNN